MKHLYSLLLLFLTITIGYSQNYVPEGINYQAVVYDEENLNPGLNAKDFVLRNQNINIRFTVIEESTNGTEVFQETHATKTDNFGLFSIIIGKGTQTSSNAFSSISWGKTAHFLKVEIDKKGGSNYHNMGVQELWSVPYSLSTKYAENAGNGITTVSDNGDGTMTFTYQNGSKYITPKLVGLTGPKGDIGLTGAQGEKGDKGDAGAQGVAGVDGANGKNTLVNTTIEAAGVNCATGGTKIEYGLDANKDGILDASEIDATLTKYLCNGADGAQNAWSLTGNSGTDPTTNFIGTTDAKDLIFKTNNSESIRVTSNGNVGIGTSSPQRALEIVSPSAPLRLKALSDGCYAEFYTPAHQNSNSRAGWIGYGGLTNKDYYITNQVPLGALRMRTNNVERLIIDSIGNVGIGTSNPDNKLHLNESMPYSFINSNPIKSQFSIHASGTGQRLLMGSYYTSGVGSGSAIQSADFFNNKDYPTKLVLQPIGGNVGIGTSNPLGKFHINNDVIGSDSAFVVTNRGYVGIGTTTPVRTLHIESRDVPLRLKSTGDGCYTEFFTPGYTNSSNRAAYLGFPNISSQDFHIANQTNAGGINFRTMNLNRMIIDSSGYLLVNTAQRQVHLGKVSQLSIKSESPAPISIQRDYINCSYAAINTVDSVYFGVNTYGNVSVGHNLDAGHNSFQISSNGNVGIGTNAPARTLHVNSVMRLEPIPTAPTSPGKGDIYFDSTFNKLRVYDGTTWQNCW
jgi:hypothetical protein